MEELLELDMNKFFVGVSIGLFVLLAIVAAIVFFHDGSSERQDVQTIATPTEEASAATSDFLLGGKLFTLSSDWEVDSVEEKNADLTLKHIDTSLSVLMSVVPISDVEPNDQGILSKSEPVIFLNETSKLTYTYFESDPSRYITYSVCAEKNKICLYADFRTVTPENYPKAVEAADIFIKTITAK